MGERDRRRANSRGTVDDLSGRLRIRPSAPVPTRRISTAIAVLVLMTTVVTASAGETTGGTNSFAGGLEFQQNLKQVGHLDIPGAVAIAFASKKPLAYVSTRGNDAAALVVMDIAEPKKPKVLATVPVDDVGQEDLNLAERADGTAFVLLGPPFGPKKDLDGTPRQNGLTIVDVSDVPGKAAEPRVVGGIPQGSHTWTCVGRGCEYAFGTVGLDDDRKTFTVVDLRIPANPKVVATHQSLVGEPIQTHDWNHDDAGVMWAVGSNGIAAYNVDDPTKPLPLNTSDRNGQFLASEYNDRSHLHGSLRPNARSFRTATDPSVHSGNVLLVSEEGDDLDCTDSFQTWHVPHLDAGQLPKPPSPNNGTITPLDNWSLLNDTVPGVERPADPDFCSVHWFDYHQGGFVVMATYRSGTRVLDVRNACNIVQVGYNFTEHGTANHSYWVPERNSSGHTNGRASHLVYTADTGSSVVTGVGEVAVKGGIDIFEATLPATSRAGCSGK